MNKMKETTKAVVYEIAVQLIIENGSTTTHEVVAELRMLGYFAKSKQVSEWMRELANEWDWNKNLIDKKFYIFSFEIAEPEEEIEEEDDEIELKTIFIKNRKSASTELSQFCAFTAENDFMEVTKWSNGEGYDVYISTKRNGDVNFQLTWGEFDALKSCIKNMEESDSE